MIANTSHAPCVNFVIVTTTRTRAVNTAPVALMARERMTAPRSMGVREADVPVRSARSIRVQCTTMPV